MLPADSRMRTLAPEVHARLRWVTVEDPSLDLGPFPDFLMIGPQRTGTTWLHDNLASHPQLWLPPAKELYYFSSLEFPGTYPAWMPPRSSDLDWYLAHFRPTEEQRRAREQQCRELWGEPFEGTVRGEGTASYAAGLSEAVIDDVLALNPALRVIVLVRDPVDRAWSHAKKDLAPAGASMAAVDEDRIAEFVQSYYQLACGRYSAFLPLWEQRLRPEHLLVAPFADVIERPPELLMRVMEFVGVRAERRYVRAAAREQINPTASAAMPPRIRGLLEELFADERQWLAGRGWL